MIIIEFAGPACAGKSTLIQRLHKDLGAEGFHVRSVDARSIFDRSDLLRVLGDPRIALWCLLNLRKVARKRSSKLLLGGIGAIRRLRSEPGVLLLDEGPARMFQNVVLHSPRGARLIWAAAPRPDVMIILTCDPVVRLKRMRAADRPHIRHLTDAEVLARPRAELFARAFARAQGAPVIEIDTSGGDIPDDLPQRLRPWLMALSSDRRSPRSRHVPGHDVEASAYREVRS